MKLKKLVKNLLGCQIVVITNCDEEIIVEGRLDEIKIIVNYLGDEQITAIYSDRNYLEEDYTTISLDIKRTQKDVFRAISDYLNTLSYSDLVTIIGDKLCSKFIRENL